MMLRYFLNRMDDDELSKNDWVFPLLFISNYCDFVSIVQAFGKKLFEKATETGQIEIMKYLIEEKDCNPFNYDHVLSFLFSFESVDNIFIGFDLKIRCKKSKT